MIPRRTRENLHLRAGDRCELCGEHATNAHHRRNRSQGGTDVLSNLMLLCGTGTTGCHGNVTDLPKWAAQFGWTIRGTTREPWEVPVLLHARSFWQPCQWSLLDDEGGVVSVVSDPDDPRIQECLVWSCDVCAAPAGVMCVNTVRPGEPLPGRLMHSARLVDRRRTSRAVGRSRDDRGVR